MKKGIALLISVFALTGCAIIDNGVKNAKTINPEICAGLETQTVDEVRDRLGNPTGFKKLDDKTIVRTYSSGYFVGTITFVNDRVSNADCKTEYRKDFRIF